MAKSCNCEFVIFAVSTHLASHSFQLKVTTPGAANVVDMTSEANGIDKFGALLQAYVTENTTSLFEKKRKIGKQCLRIILVQYSVDRLTKQ